MSMSSYDDEINNDPELKRLRGELQIRAPNHRSGLPCINVMLDGECIKASFCEKAKCRHLLSNPTQCSKRRFTSHLDLRPKHTTLRNRGQAGGWYYRKI